MSPVLRWTRALLLAGVAISTGSLAHASTGGLLPGPLAMVAILVTGTCVCAALLGRPASRLRVVLLVTAGQAVVHLVLTACVGHAGDPAPGVPGLAAPGAARSGTFFDQTMPAVAPVDLATPAWVTHLVTDLSGPHAWMAVAHLAAAALVGLWLASGERALTALLQLVTRQPLPELPLPTPLSRIVSGFRTRIRVPRLWRDAVARRGPPYSFA